MDAGSAKLDRITIAILSAGAALSLLLVFSVPGEVYYSGDGGVKALLARQIAQGEPPSPVLKLHAPGPVSAAWADGLYPFEPPFVYVQPQGHVVSFPLAFPILSAPFYQALGFRGFYVLPVLGVWCTWLIMLAALGKLRLTPAVRQAALISLIFATHLTLFAGTFWEHAPAVAMAALALHYLATARSAGFATPYVCLAGALLGAAFLLRSEMLLFAVLAAAYVGYRRREYPRASLFVASTAVALAACLALNFSIYGHPLGLHQEQVSREGFGLARLVSVAHIAVALWARLGLFVPLSVVVIATSGWLLGRHPETLSRLETRGLLAVGLSFLVLSPLILPNAGGKQPGPRYLLVLAPLWVLVAAELLARFETAAVSRLSRLWYRRAFLAALLLGAVVNSAYKVRDMRAEYRARWRATSDLAHAAPTLIAVTHPFAAQELAALMPNKQLLLVRGPADFLRAMRAARELSQSSLLVASIWEPESAWLPAGLKSELRGAYGVVDVRTVALPGSDPSR